MRLNEEETGRIRSRLNKLLETGPKKRPEILGRFPQRGDRKAVQIELRKGQNSNDIGRTIDPDGELEYRLIPPEQRNEVSNRVLGITLPKENRRFRRLSKEEIQRRAGQTLDADSKGNN